MTVTDTDGLELPQEVVEAAIDWLEWRYSMTKAESAAVLQPKRQLGPTRERQRTEAICVADFLVWRASR